MGLLHLRTLVLEVLDLLFEVLTLLLQNLILMDHMLTLAIVRVDHQLRWPIPVVTPTARCTARRELAAGEGSVRVALRMQHVAWLSLRLQVTRQMANRMILLMTVYTVHGLSHRKVMLVVA